MPFSEAVGVDEGTSSPGVLVETATSANAKGSYVELVSALPFDCEAMTLLLGHIQSGGNRDWLLDLALGAASSEIVVIPNMIHSSMNITIRAMLPKYIRKYLPKGERLALRVQDTSGFGDLGVGAILHYGGVDGSDPFQAITAYGADTSDSGGVSVDPGATANTKGAYSEIVAATSDPIDEFYIGIGNQVNGGRQASLFLLDIAIGAASSETVILGNVGLSGNANIPIFPRWLGPFRYHIPAGTRIAARAQCSITDATDRTFDVIIYGAH